MSTLPEDFDASEDRGPPPEIMDPLLDLMPGHALNVNQREFVTLVGVDVLPTERFQTQPPEMLYGEETQGVKNKWRWKPSPFTLRLGGKNHPLLPTILLRPSPIPPPGVMLSGTEF